MISTRPDPRDRLLPTERFFGGHPPWMVLLLSFVFVIVVGVLDFANGPAVSLAPFSLMGVILVTWNVGRRWGVILAGLAAVGAQLAAIGKVGTAVLEPSWNATVWFGAFLLVVWLLSELKGLIAMQRDRLVQQTEVSDDLRQMNQVKDTLLHAVSHDLKGPIAGILGAMQTIRRAEQLRLSHEEMLSLYDVIQQGGKKMDRLVDDLLDLDRIDRGQLEPERQPTDVGEIARRAAREVVGLDAHPVRVEADEVLVDVDPAKVERIVENLLVNAGRHTPLGTPVHVQVIGRPSGVVVIVEDEGRGVPDDVKDAIFEAFRQGANAAGRGAGIGLSLVRRFAELHGGSAHVEDRQGGGARFVITLPGAISKPVSVPNLRAV